MNHKQYKRVGSYRQYLYFALKQLIAVYKADFIAIRVIEGNVYHVLKDRLGNFEADSFIDDTTYRNIISQYDCPLVVPIFEYIKGE